MLAKYIDSKRLPIHIKAYHQILLLVHMKKPNINAMICLITMNINAQKDGIIYGLLIIKYMRRKKKDTSYYLNFFFE
jgi:hypothetical protein